MISDELKVKIYCKMITIRYFEESIKEVYMLGLMPGLAHLYTGQEAVAVGVCTALDEKDYITSTHRGHGHLIAKGSDLRKMMAEVLGKSTGYCKGKGGSMHISDPEIGILGANGIVGASIPLACGVGLQIKLKKKNSVVVCFFGDGASNQGVFHEGLNLAGLWNLPVVFVCENNLYGISVRQNKHQAIKDIAIRANSYGFEGIVVDGNDVIKVYEITKQAVLKARDGKGPTLIECKTYRWGGHHVGDPGTAYRQKEEIENWKENCPIKKFREKLFEENILNEEKDENIKKEIKNSIEDAISFAKESPFPDKEEALKDI